ncbi:helix-turn-helix transcriptional regulator [Candidatus Woesebacteria bacterium]|nr:helix-turn-helix transcriptional regulator [Candidatus Woesebacteria bacterium]
MFTKPRKKSTRNNPERTKFRKELATLVKSVREKKKITQEELADLAGLNSAYIGHLERGVYSPTLYVTWKIAEALGIPLQELLQNFPKK